MKKTQNESGYALLIVLFLIVFIMIILAVFMRNSISNAKQENVVNENNLVVVSAEAGVDYYTWEIKKVYDITELQKELDRLMKQAIDDLEKPSDLINFQEIQSDLSDFLRNSLDEKAKQLKDDNSKNIIKEYNHTLFDYEIKPPVFIETGGIKTTIIGNVLGESNNKYKSLDFVLDFIIPQLESDNNSEEVNGNIVLKDPKLPNLPRKLTEMEKPSINCNTRTIINNTKCYFTTNDNSSLEKVEGNSQVYSDGGFSGDPTKKIESSYLYSNFIGGGTWVLRNSRLYVKTNLAGWANFDIQGSKMYVGGDFSKSGVVDIQGSEILTDGNFSFQSGGKISKSVIKVAKNFNSPSSLDIQETHLTVDGKFEARTGEKIDKSFVKVGLDFIAPSKMIYHNSEISIGGKLQLKTGGNLQNTTMKVALDVLSPSNLILQNSNVGIGGLLKLDSGGNFQNSVLKVGNKITTANLIEIQKSSVYSKSIDMERGVLELQDTKLCTENLNVRELKLDNKSKVYYLNSSNKTGSDIIKLAKDEFEKTCGFGAGDQTPPLPSDIDWIEPILDKVDYN